MITTSEIREVILSYKRLSKNINSLSRLNRLLQRKKQNVTVFMFVFIEKLKCPNKLFELIIVFA